MNWGGLRFTASGGGGEMRLNAVSHIGFSYQGTQLIRGFNMTNLIEHNFLFGSAGNTPNIDLIKN